MQHCLLNTEYSEKMRKGSEMDGSDSVDILLSEKSKLTIRKNRFSQVSKRNRKTRI